VSVVSVEVTVPDRAAAAALFGAVVAIDLWAIRWKRATVSRWVRHQVRRRPAITLTFALLLAAHLVAELPADPFRWAAGWLAQPTGEHR
jgi:hypothetical protein